MMESEDSVLYQTEVYENSTFYYGESGFSTSAPVVETRQTPNNMVLNIITVACYSIIFTLGVAGNSLVIVTLIQNKRMRSVTNVFLFSLSVSDILFLCVCLPFTLVGNMLHNFIFGPVMCKLVHYTMVVSVAVSVWTMVAIALERYHAICNPLASRAWQTKSRAFKIIALIWVSAFVIGLPDLIVTKLELYDEVNMRSSCRPRWNMNGIMVYIHPFYLFVAFMVLPLILFTFAYGLIIFELWRGMMSEKRATAKEKEENGTPMRDFKLKASSTGPDTNANDPFLKNNGKGIYRPPSAKSASRNVGPVRSTSSNNAKKRVVRMLIVLVVLFFVAWSPTWIINMWHVVNRDAAYGFLGKVPHLVLIIRLMSYSSACVNPIVYCFMNRSFRNGFLEVFKCCTKRYKPVNEDTKPTIGTGPGANRTRLAGPPDSTTNYTNVSSGDED